MSYRIGFDIGSTTIKAVVMNENGEILYKSYERHKAQIREMALAKIEELKDLLGDEPFYFAPVSYTHLDVYKRQVSQRCWRSARTSPMAKKGSRWNTERSNSIM